MSNAILVRKSLARLLAALDNARDHPGSESARDALDNATEAARAVLDETRGDVYPSSEEAIKAADEWESPIHSIRHVVRSGEGWVILGHINCEWCDHCNTDPQVKGTRHAISCEV